MEAHTNDVPNTQKTSTEITKIDHVYIHFTSHRTDASSGSSPAAVAEVEFPSGKISGTLAFSKRSCDTETEYELTWSPRESGSATFSSLVCTLSYGGFPSYEPAQTQKEKEAEYVGHGFSVVLSDVKSIRKELSVDSACGDEVVLSLRDGTVLPALYFEDKGAVDWLWTTLANVFTIEEVEANVFSLSFTNPSSEDMNIARGAGSFVILGGCDNGAYNDGSTSESSSDGSDGGYDNGFGWGGLYSYLSPFNYLGGFSFWKQQQQDGSSSTPKSDLSKKGVHCVELANIDIGFVKKCLDETGNNSSAFEFLGPEVAPLCDKPAPLTPSAFSAMFDESVGGRMSVDGAIKLREALFSGAGFAGDSESEGDVSEVRREAWKFMLGFYPPQSTRAERTEKTRDRAKSYAELKLQWKGIDSERMEYCKGFAENLTRIKKDVLRTDREYSFFAEDSRIQSLYDILATYVWYALDSEYVQGMNDFCAVPMEVMNGDEAATFWCFKAIMDRVASNFRVDETGIRAQLCALYAVLGCVDPDLQAHLERVRAQKMFFCYRWILVLFKREYSFEDTKRLWEALFSGVAGPRFHLFVALAMLMLFRGAVLKHKFDTNAILQLVTIAGNADLFPLDRVLSIAWRAYVKFCNVCTDKSLIDYMVGAKDSLPDRLIFHSL